MEQVTCIYQDVVIELCKMEIKQTKQLNASEHATLNIVHNTTKYQEPKEFKHIGTGGHLT